jgi:GNAT superfamily N-acetyltransferase
VSALASTGVVAGAMILPADKDATMTAQDLTPTAAGDKPRAATRILKELRGTVEFLADEMVPILHGWVFRSRSLDKVFALNQVRFRGPVDFARAVAVADEQMSGMRFRHVVVEDDSGEDLEGHFAESGWDIERTVLMRLVGEPQVAAGDIEVVDLSEEQMVDIMETWALEEHVGILPDRLAQLSEYNRRAGRLWNEGCLGVLDESGIPVAITKLRIQEKTAWVEDVYTVPTSRRRGYARMLVSQAAVRAQAAGCSFTFMIADDDDWPKDLYSDIGFEPVGVARSFRLRTERA